VHKYSLNEAVLINMQLTFLWQWKYQLWSSGLWQCVVLEIVISVSQKSGASIFRVKLITVCPLRKTTALKNAFKLKVFKLWNCGICKICCIVCSRFDSELQLLHDELRQEKQQKDRISREKELLIAEKYSLEQNLSVSFKRIRKFTGYIGWPSLSVACT
jgi:hypothetical protein